MFDEQKKQEPANVADDTNIMRGGDMFTEGEKITVIMDHSLNSKSKTTLYLDGTFIRQCNSKRRHPGQWEPNKKCLVKLDRNKNPCKVFESQIRHRA